MSEDRLAEIRAELDPNTIESIRRQNDLNDAMLDAIERDEDTRLSAFTIASMGVDYTRALLAEVERLVKLEAAVRHYHEGHGYIERSGRWQVVRVMLEGKG